MIKQLLLYILHRSRYFRWYRNFPWLNGKHLNSLMPYYKECGKEVSVELTKKRVICVMNGNFEAGGLADRLRTIVSTYQVCKELGFEFKLLFTSPFKLENYLLPNAYDWKINADEVNFNTSTEIVCCEITDDTRWQAKKVHEYLSNRLSRSTKNEIHVYGNPSFCFTEGTYSELFFELFKLSPALDELLQQNIKALDSEYNVMQLRFTSLLGDLNDICGVLPADEQMELINTCLKKVKEFKAVFSKEERLLVCSDSMKFLKLLKEEVPDAYIVEGNVVHIDYTEADNDDAFIKLFVEFFLMSKAKRVFRMVEKRMRKSGLPYSAALLSGKECSDIEF